MIETQQEVEARLKAALAWATAQAALASPAIPNNASVISAGEILVTYCYRYESQSGTSAASPHVVVPVMEPQVAPAEPANTTPINLDPDVELSAEAVAQVREAMLRPGRRIPQLAAVLALTE